MKTLQNEDGSPASVLTYFIGTIDDSFTSGEKAGIMERVKQTLGSRMWARWNLPAANFEARLIREIAAEVEYQRLRYVQESQANRTPETVEEYFAKMISKEHPADLRAAVVSQIKADVGDAMIGKWGEPVADCNVHLMAQIYGLVNVWQGVAR